MIKQFKNIAFLLMNMFLYYLLQIIGSFISFGVFGSGIGIEGYELYIPIVMVIVQIILINLLKYKSSLLKNIFVYVLSMITPIGLLIFYYWSNGISNIVSANL